MLTWRVRRCPRCRRRRRVYPGKTTFDRWGNEYLHWRCSRGHRWRAILQNVARTSRLLRRVYAPAISKMLNAENQLLKWCLNDRPVAGPIPFKVGR